MDIFARRLTTKINGSFVKKDCANYIEMGNIVSPFLQAIQT